VARALPESRCHHAFLFCLDSARQHCLYTPEALNKISRQCFGLLPGPHEELPRTIFDHLLRSTCGRLQDEQLDDGRWLGHRTFLVDGSSFFMPDTPELQTYFGQPDGQLPGCGFPVAHLMALFHAASGMLLEVFVIGVRSRLRALSRMPGNLHMRVV
jgi:hypothetical protein